MDSSITQLMAPAATENAVAVRVSPLTSQPNSGQRPTSAVARTAGSRRANHPPHQIESTMIAMNAGRNPKVNPIGPTRVTKPHIETARMAVMMAVNTANVFCVRCFTGAVVATNPR